MRYEPVNNWIIGRALVLKDKSSIKLVNPSHGISRHYWIEEVSEEAAQAGYRPGGMIIAKSVYDMYLYRGEHRVVLTTDLVVSKVHDFSLDEFVTLKDEPFVPPNPNGAPRASEVAQAGA